MWVILESDEVLKAVRKLQPELLKKYELWKGIVRISGPSGLRPIKGFHDEALTGKWKGFRSSRLDKQVTEMPAGDEPPPYDDRVLYRVEADEVAVCVVDVNAHEYRR